MRILFSAVPAHGHVLPMLPLARAALGAGHEVALLTHASMANAAPSIRLLPVGTSMEETLADVRRRTGGSPLGGGLDLAVEFFVDSRIDAGAADALAAAHDFRPDLVVADMVDHVGQ